MDLLLDELKSWGCDVDGAMERFVEDEALYRSCLDTVLKDKAFAGLGTALQDHEKKKAFEYAHTLKGVLGNLGLTPMYDIAVRIVEPLRNGQMEGLFPEYEELLQARGYLEMLLEKTR